MRDSPEREYFFLGAWVDGVGSGPKDSSAAAKTLLFGAKSSFYCSKSTFWEILSLKYTFWSFNSPKMQKNRDSFEINSRDPRQILMRRAANFI